MASTVSNGNDRSEKWQRSFQIATTVYEREICVAVVDRTVANESGTLGKNRVDSMVVDYMIFVTVITSQYVVT